MQIHQYVSVCLYVSQYVSQLTPHKIAFYVKLYRVYAVISVFLLIFFMPASLPSSAVSCIPLAPTASSQCLCCKQPFLPPFILVKSFQIYYVLTKLSVGPMLERHPGCTVAFWPPTSSFFLLIFFNIFIFCWVETSPHMLSLL